MDREKHSELVAPEAVSLCSCHGAAEALRHDQVWMCAFCKQATASVLCKADAGGLRAACDANIHFSNPFTRRHERLPLPNPSTKLPASGADGFLFGSVNDVVEDEDKLESTWWLLPEPPPEIRLAAQHHLSPQADPFFDNASSAVASLGRAESIVPEQGELKLPSNNGVLENNFAQLKPSNDSHWVFPATMDREARVMRYREKRKNRRFQKTIRYASRKAYAETRPRVKGRFAKRTDAESEANWIFSSMAEAAAVGAPLMVDTGYGVVPSF